MSKMDDVRGALGYKPLQKRTETSEKPLCKNSAKTVLQSALDEEKADGGKDDNKE